ncbi:LutC/YkgG family protein [Pedobacter rhizosphaerae]|uniref:L-lactate dehydrogenase complex protein LldG n=1 Tax=Pedobacter rhizosphaerae TaxID=390241 RepID=A0A1H9KMH3_9SPHI|nr:LUD domain-containing protein [Pedobacter rhizosphaerae]SER00366.1 L-lactate dehydrogenase complex protein LldG [Pedobacter rhizosphaerae]
MSRAQILSAILNNQPQSTLLPEDLQFDSPSNEVVSEKFCQMINLIGGKVVVIQKVEDINLYISEHFTKSDRIITPIEELDYFTPFTGDEVPHDFVNTEFAVFKTHFAVAENGAVWITEDRMGHRVLPFITQHLGMLVEENQIVATMHDAYKKMADAEYDFGTFVAGPSKTADIEQSLVLGAHGARSMTIFLLK